MLNLEMLNLEMLNLEMLNLEMLNLEMLDLETQFIRHTLNNLYTHVRILKETLNR